MQAQPDIILPYEPRRASRRRIVSIGWKTLFASIYVTYRRTVI